MIHGNILLSMIFPWRIHDIVMLWYIICTLWESNMAGWKISELNGGFIRKITDSWFIFQHAIFDCWKVTWHNHTGVTPFLRFSSCIYRRSPKQRVEEKVCASLLQHMGFLQDRTGTATQRGKVLNETEMQERHGKTCKDQAWQPDATRKFWPWQVLVALRSRSWRPGRWTTQQSLWNKGHEESHPV